MIKINPDAVLERETAAVRSNRAICIGIKQGGVKLWLKGKRDFFVVSYEDLYQFAIRNEQRGLCIAPRKVSDAKLAKARAAIEENLPT